MGAWRTALARGTALALLCVAVAPSPAAATHLAGTVIDEAVFSGMAAVGKFPGGQCHNDDIGYSPFGAGMGLPVLNGPKQVYYLLQAVATTGAHGFGSLEVCGRMVPVASFTIGGSTAFVGAACGANQGILGFGRLVTPSLSLKLMSIRWESSMGGTVLYRGRIADVTGNTKKKTGHIVGMFQAQGALACTTKAGSEPNKTGGATDFTVAGYMQILA